MAARAGLLDRIAAARGTENRFGVDTWIADYLYAANGYGGFSTIPGVTQTLAGMRIQEIAGTLPGHLAALRRCPPAFAAQMVRALVLSQARFTFRNLPSSPTPRRLFGTNALSVLETPWTNATTGELLARMEWHEGLAGNSYVVRRPGRLRVLRPDWVGLVYGSELEPDDPAHALDGDLLGYVYCNGGFGSGNKPQTLLPADVAHWSPLPDPENAGVGMSWITPAVREILGDQAATEHKLRFFTNGATPNMVVKGLPANREQFLAAVNLLDATHTGLENAYRTLYLTAGADVTVVGKDLQQIDFRAVQGAGETRITMLSRVHPVILAAAEGLQGSALNAGNFGMARRIWADTWIFPMLQDLSASLQTIVDVPPNPKTGLRDSELWADTTDMPILREDARDAADIQRTQAETINGLVKEGFTPDSAIAAVMGQNMTLLKHTGLVSVQLQPPGGPAGLPPEQQSARTLVEMIQKVYLGVGVVISEDEGRQILNQAGANLPIPAPPLSTGNGSTPAAVGG